MFVLTITFRKAGMENSQLKRRLAESVTLFHSTHYTCIHLNTINRNLIKGPLCFSPSYCNVTEHSNDIIMKDHHILTSNMM